MNTTHMKLYVTYNFINLILIATKKGISQIDNTKQNINNILLFQKDYFNFPRNQEEERKE